MFGNSEKKGSFFERLKGRRAREPEQEPRGRRGRDALGEERVNCDLFEELEVAPSPPTWGRPLPRSSSTR